MTSNTAWNLRSVRNESLWNFFLKKIIETNVQGKFIIIFFNYLFVIFFFTLTLGEVITILNIV